jgi:predicted nucleic acid-binding protein
VVIDASLALAWCFPDEASDYAATVLINLENCTIWVPGIWSLEIANAVVVGERRKRLKEPEIRQFINLLDSLRLVQDIQPANELIPGIVPLARKYSLSAYDAAYLDVSIRRAAQFATLDSKLATAAKAAGVSIFRPNA